MLGSDSPVPCPKIARESLDVHQDATKPVVLLRLRGLCALIVVLCSSTFGMARGGVGQRDNRPGGHGDVPQAHVAPQTLTLPVVEGKNIRFTRLSTEDGLSQTKVSQIVQDDQGFMWLGSQYGLNRYDGYKFKVFKHEAGRANSLSGVYITALFKDRSGSLWVGCDEFLDKFDPVTETFAHYLIDTRDIQGGTVPVTHISQDHTGILWLATSRGLFRFDPSSGRTVRYRHDPKNRFSLSSDAIKSTGEDRSGTFWAATSEGLDAFDRDTGKVTLHVPLHESGEMSFHEDRFGVFWIIHVSGDGLAVFDRKTNTLSQYSFRLEHASKTAPNGVMTMLEDRNGTMWFGTIAGGLLKFDRRGQRLIRYHNVPADLESLGEDSLLAMDEDREGNIWASLGGLGVTHFASEPLPFKRFRRDFGDPDELGEPFVGGIYEDRRRILWIGTHERLSRIDRDSGKNTSYEVTGPGEASDVITINEDRAGNLWVGTFNHGLYRMDAKTGHFRKFQHNPADPTSLSNDIVPHLLVDHNGTLWAATWDGLDRFDPVTERFTTYKLDPDNRDLYFLKLAEDRQGALWVGTHSSGIARFDPATGRFTVYHHDPNRPGTLSDNRVNSVHFDRSGTMWVGTQDGLNEFDPKTGQFTVYGQRNGFHGTAVGCILDDDQGELWMSTNNGVAGFDPQKKTVRNYSTADGLPGPDLTGWGTCFKSASGEMFFGGFSGATAFFPDKLQDSSYVPPVVLTDFQLFDQPVTVGAGSPLSKSIGYTSLLTLSHSQNLFSLEFSALSYFNPATNRYRYRLEGLDTYWHEVGSNQRIVTYTSLPAANYTFRVQGATSRGAWSEPPLELPIRILPPWWNTWWFRTMYAAIILLVVWGIHGYRLRQFAQQYNARLEERMRERARIARELHDTLLQSIHGLMLRFHYASESMAEDDPARPMLKVALQRADVLIVEGRNRVQLLRGEANEEKTLSQMLAQVALELALEGRPAIHVTEEGRLRPLRPAVQEEFCGICRESLVNSVHHAEASRIDVEIIYERKFFKVRCRDNGKGIPNDVMQSVGRKGHWGLRGMNERAKSMGAQFQIWSTEGRGTEIEIRLRATAAYARRDTLERYLRRFRPEDVT
jgi:ligand-binding sensor domain-containing protein/signal transduction histidine kinase